MGKEHAWFLSVEALDLKNASALSADVVDCHRVTIIEKRLQDTLLARLRPLSELDGLCN
jgi:hypothetical protein